MSGSKFPPADRLSGTDNNIWVTFTALARSTSAVNLGQGFPDYAPPEFVRTALKDVAGSEDFMLNQYTRGYGLPRLVNALSKLYGRFHGREIDPQTEIFVSAGAYHSLFCAFQGLINPGDEVIIVEPFFDCYLPMTTVAGGKPVFVPLRPSNPKDGDMTGDDWKLDPDELRSKFTEKTKFLVVNTPNNPLGKVYKKEELEMIAKLCIEHDVVCISDEVYEWMAYPGSVHTRIATLPGMWNRTITVSSAGKTFSVTGWKLGWSIGPAHLIKPMTLTHQNCIHQCCTITQEAVACAIELETSRIDDKSASYLYTLASNELLPKRDKLAEVLRVAGMTPAIPSGGYFMMANWSGLGIPDEVIEDGTDDPKDFKFVKWLTKEKKLACIPPSAFYSKDHRHIAEDYVRFCFFKKDETLEAASNILRNFAK